MHLAKTEEEKEAVQRFRYNVYVEEMGRYGQAADHQNRRLVEHYQLAPFPDELPLETLAVGERGMVVPRLRSSDVFRELGRYSSAFVEEHRIQLVFGICEPHPLSLYLGQACRTFAKNNINSAEAGYLIPIVTVVEDVEQLRRIGSPLAEASRDYGDDARIPKCVGRLIDSSSVMSERLSKPGDYAAEVRGVLRELAQNRLSALDGSSEEELPGSPAQLSGARSITTPPERWGRRR